MEFSFMHIADTHLGFRQYGLKDRYNDYARALMWAVQQALQHRVDFVVLAGDLFHEPSRVAPHTLTQVIQILTPLHQARIPCLAIEGNHDKPQYASGDMSWIRFLAEKQGLLQLLNFVPDDADTMQPASARNPVGNFSEPLPGVRVYGMGFKGAGTKAALAAWTQVLQNTPREDVQYSILMLHTGLEGKIARNVTGTLTVGDLMPLQPCVDYVALGHYHKPFEHDGWIYNPGSLEITASDILDDRNPVGVKLVQVDTNQQPVHRVTHLRSPIRPWLKFRFNVNRAQTPEQLQQDLLTSLGRGYDPESAANGEHRAPLVHITLWGRLNFPSSLLDLNLMKEQVSDLVEPLYCQIHLQPADNPETVQGLSSHRTLYDIEQQVLLDTIREHPRYKADAAHWRSAAHDLMMQVLTDASPKDLYATLSAYDTRTTTDNHAAD